jgi:DnaK suppressor protein
MGPEELTDGQIDELRLRLLALRAELEGQQAQAADSTKVVAPDNAIGRLTRLDAMQQRGMAIEEQRRREVRLQQITGALAAVESKDYGFCRRCQEPIGYKRLTAKPESPFCMPCTGGLERRLGA